MANVVVFQPGGYRYISAYFQYSGGVAAEAGFEMERARLARPVPLVEGFRIVEAHLKGSGGRPPPSPPASCARLRRSPSRASSTSTAFTCRPSSAGASTR